MSDKSQESSHQEKMAVQFAGLEMETLIGSPLVAASAAQQELAMKAYEFFKETELQESDHKA